MLHIRSQLFTQKTTFLIMQQFFLVKGKKLENFEKRKLEKVFHVMSCPPLGNNCAVMDWMEGN
jgi:hypothetical protein